MLGQTEFSEDRLRIALQDLFGRCILVKCEEDSDEALYDVGVAIALEMHPALSILLADVGGNPHLARTAAHLVGISAQGFGEFGQLAAKLDDIPVAVFPIVEQSKVISDV